jgi:hypothetical protein
MQPINALSVMHHDVRQSYFILILRSFCHFLNSETKHFHFNQRSQVLFIENIA